MTELIQQDQMEYSCQKGKIERLNHDSFIIALFQ